MHIRSYRATATGITEDLGRPIPIGTKMLISAPIQSLVKSSQLCTRLAALRKHFVVHVRTCYDYYHYNICD